MTTFLIATDGSTTADAAVDTAVKLAEEENADVVFLHVVDEIDVHVLSLMEPGSIPRALDHPNLSEPLQHAASVAREHGVAYELRLASGYDVDVILETADAIDAEVIAVGSTARFDRNHPAWERREGAAEAGATTGASAASGSGVG